MKSVEESSGISNSTNGYWERAALSRAEEFNSIPPFDFDALSLGRQRISEDIAALQQITASFKHILANLAPVNALPAEIIARCFEILSEGYPPEPYYKNEKCLGWIVVTHVCRRWRDIALSQTTLWHKPSQSLGTQGFLEMLTRAGSSLLTINLDSDKYCIENVVYNALASHHATLQEVAISSPSLMKNFPIFLTHTAPRLHSITIYSRGGFDIPPNLFGGYLPQLHHVRLNGVSQTWLRAPFKDLVTLDITHIDYYSPLESFDLLLNMLDNNRCLARLSLCQVLPRGMAAAPPIRLVRLPHLHHITLTWSEDVSCGRLLDALEAAPDVKLHLDHVQLTNDAGHTLILSLSRHISRRHDPPRCVEFKTRQVWLEFRLWSKPVKQLDSCMLMFSFDHPDDQHDFPWDDHNMAPAIVRDLIKHLVPADTRAVSLIGRSPKRPSASAMWDGLSLLEKVEEFSLADPDIIAQLCSPVTSEMQGTDRVLWPLLRTITYDFWNARCWFKSRVDQVPKMLLPILASRANIGCPVQELRLLDSTFEGSELTELRELVPKVTQPKT